MGLGNVDGGDDGFGVRLAQAARPRRGAAMSSSPARPRSGSLAVVPRKASII